MKKVEFQQIGTYEFDSKGNQIRIAIKRGLNDALIKLDYFSHCVIFTKENHGFNCYLARIVKILEKAGEMLIESYENPLAGELVDIKPYFPCEEKADGYDKGIVLRGKDFEPLLFKGKSVGKFFNTHNGGVIQFQESENASADAITKSIMQIKEGAFLRVIWWFDRFDDKRYRSHLMCNPPYDNAPRCGVFATRSPVRPNPLASTIVKVKATDPYNRNISILGFDGFADSMILQVMPYQEIDICGVKAPEWVGHWTDRKVFHDIPEIETHVDMNNNAVFDGSSYYFEELDRNEIFEQENTDSNEIVVEGASIHNLKIQAVEAERLPDRLKAWSTYCSDYWRKIVPPDR